MNTKLLLIAGRVLLSVIFILSGISKITNWNGTESMMASKGIPLTSVALAIVVLVELGGGLLLLLGIYARWAALVLFLYLIPVTLTMHNFWAYSGPQRQSNQINFLKNVSIMGGLLAFAAREPNSRRPA